MIRFDNVIINIGDFQLTVNMTVQKGFVTVIGHSGAGKSTLLLSLSGHQDLASGKIFVDQNRIDLLPPINVRALSFFKILICFRIFLSPKI